FSSDGKTLVWSDDQNRIVVSDAGSGKEIRRYPGLGKDVTVGGGKFGASKVYRAAIEGLALSPNGKLLAAINSDKTVQVREVASGTLVESLPTSGLATQIVFTVDGKGLVVGETYRVRIWNWEKKAASRYFEGWQFALSPDGKTIAVGAGDG